MPAGVAAVPVSAVASGVAEGCGVAAAGAVVPDHSRNLAHNCPNSSCHIPRNYRDFFCVQPLHVFRRSWPEVQFPPTISIPTPLRRYAKLSLNAPLVPKTQLEEQPRPSRTHIPSVEVRKFCSRGDESGSLSRPNKAHEQSRLFATRCMRSGCMKYNPKLKDECGEALRALLYLFERDEAVPLIGAA